MQESKETIGQRLRQIRAARKISIEKAAEDTHIRVQYLQALEADNYSAMASAAQGRGFLRLYAGYLDLDLDTAMAELREGGTAGAPSEPVVPAEVIPTPVSSEPPSTPSADEKPAPRPFWARLLRRSPPESSAGEDPLMKREEPPEKPGQTLETEPAAKSDDKKKASK
jgi:transcriptional regulator with XRE-family HTH domain